MAGTAGWNVFAVFTVYCVRLSNGSDRSEWGGFFFLNGGVPWFH